jgi:hypothetical protein
VRIALPRDSQGIARAGSSSSAGRPVTALWTPRLQRGLVAHNEHRLLTTARAVLEVAGFRDLADLPPLEGADDEDRHVGTTRLAHRLGNISEPLHPPA